MTLEDIRREIDGIDSQLLPLFLQRMKCAEKVAAVKKAKGLPVLNEGRERQILNRISAKAGIYGGEARILYANMMAMSRAVQHRLLGSGGLLRMRHPRRALSDVSEKKGLFPMKPCNNFIQVQSLFSSPIFQQSLQQ